MDAGNGMAGLVAPRVFEHLPCEWVPLYFELDGSFPHHPASPIEPENMIDVQQKVRAVGPDLGPSFDGDPDPFFPGDDHSDLVYVPSGTAIFPHTPLLTPPPSTLLHH